MPAGLARHALDQRLQRRPRERVRGAPERGTGGGRVARLRRRLALQFRQRGGEVGHAGGQRRAPFQRVRAVGVGGQQRLASREPDGRQRDRGDAQRQRPP